MANQHRDRDYRGSGYRGGQGDYGSKYRGGANNNSRSYSRYDSRSYDRNDRSPSPYRRGRAPSPPRAPRPQDRDFNAAPPRGPRRGEHNVAPPRGPRRDEYNDAPPRGPRRDEQDDGPPRGPRRDDHYKRRGDPIDSKRDDKRRREDHQPPPHRTPPATDADPTNTSTTVTNAAAVKTAYVDEFPMYIDDSQKGMEGATQLTGKLEIDDTDYDALLDAPKNEPTEEEMREQRRARWAAIKEQDTRENTGAPSTATSGPGSPNVVPENRSVSKENSPAAEAVSAAEYDPNTDLEANRERMEVVQRLDGNGDDAQIKITPTAITPCANGNPHHQTEQQDSDEEFDMFNPDTYDLLDKEDNSKDDDGKVLGKGLERDDNDGYLMTIRNELMGPKRRYKVEQQLGRGMFANVVQAVDTQFHTREKPALVAVKIVRRNDMMKTASLREAKFFEKLKEADPQDEKNILRLLDQFNHDGHLCLVFEHMEFNLRDYLKVAKAELSVTMMRSYALQMFRGLHFLQENNLIHADLKPDNILISVDRKTIKLCDLGTAFDLRYYKPEEYTENLVSRFYRAPDIILNFELGHGIDMWSIGCTLYELWTGMILFKGDTNNRMLQSFMECLGWPTEKLLKRANHQQLLFHFNMETPLKFHHHLYDPNSKIADARNLEPHQMAVKNLPTRLEEETKKSLGTASANDADKADFISLLKECLAWSPMKRIKAIDAMKHRFIVGRPVVAKKPPAIPKPAKVVHRVIKSKKHV